jgi:PAS domain S-box-containing protein
VESETACLALTLVNAMPDAVIYADAEGIVRFWNSGAERIFGFAPCEAVGRSLDMIVPQNLRQRHWDGFNETMRSGHSHYAAGAVLAVPATRKDGKRISVEFTIVPFRDASERIVGIAAVMRDVTQRFEEMKALRKAAARLVGESATNGCTLSADVLPLVACQEGATHRASAATAGAWAAAPVSRRS